MPRLAAVHLPQRRNVVLIEYWLLRYEGTCPKATGWKRVGGDCMMNSKTAPVPPQKLANLGQLRLKGMTGNGQDTVILSNAEGPINSVQTDSVLSLAGQWTDAEFGVFGEGGGSRADFNSGTTMAVRVTVNDGTTKAPACVLTGYAAESNNLSLVQPCCQAFSGSSPYITFTTSNAPDSKPCPAATGGGS